MKLNKALMLRALQCYKTEQEQLSTKGDGNASWEVLQTNKLIESLVAWGNVQAHELLATTGGSWLGYAREWMQQKFMNGSDVTWGSQDMLKGQPLRVSDIEQLAATVAAETLNTMVFVHVPRVRPAPEYPLPEVIPLTSFPANCNPFLHDSYNMGCSVSGAWMAMYNQHTGHKQSHNMTDEEKALAAAGVTVWNKDPEYIIFVNQRTGQRFKLQWPNGRDITEVMNAVIAEHEARKEQ